jgi:hypothetical protein
MMKNYGDSFKMELMLANVCLVQEIRSAVVNNDDWAGYNKIKLFYTIHN